MCYNKSALRDPNMSSLFYKYIIYFMIYFLFAFPLLVLLIISVLFEIPKNKPLRWLTFVKFIYIKIDKLLYVRFSFFGSYYDKNNSRLLKNRLFEVMQKEKEKKYGRNFTCK